MTDTDTGLKHLFLRLLDTCNLECAHCYASCGPKAKAALEFDDVLAIVDQLPDLGVQTVHLEGGEALIYRHFWDLLDALNGVGVRPAITSNGLIVTEEVLRRLSGRVKRMTFSIDGHSAPVHDRIRRKIGSFDRAVRATRVSVDLGIATHMISVVWKQSADHVDEIVSLADDMGVGRLMLFGCGRIGAAEEHWEELECSFEQWSRYLERVRELAGTRPWLWFELDRVSRGRLAGFIGDDYQPACTRTHRDTLIVDPNGDVFPCGYFIPVGKSLGNVRDIPLADLLVAPQDGERYSGACKDPWAVRDGAVHLCKVYSVNCDTLPTAVSIASGPR